MKTIGIYLIVLYWLALAEQACGQDNRTKLRNDPTYSTHNYKHANKAATARKWEANAGVAVVPPIASESLRPGPTNQANYKRQVPNQAPVGGVTVWHIPSNDVADRNYKIQRPGQPTRPTGLTAVTRKRNRTESGITIGD